MIKRDLNNYNKIIDDLKNIDILDYSFIEQFSNKLTEYTGIKYCILTCNGTSALFLGMYSLLNECDEIIIPSYSYPSALVCANRLKLNIKYCDVKYNTMCLDPDILIKTITPNTKAVVFIEHLGYVGEDLYKVKDICDKHNILLIEDSAQSLSHKNAGSIGEFGIFSFSGTKLLRSSEGGCFVTNDEELYNKVKQLHSINVNNPLNSLGNYTMSPLVAKILIEELNNIDYLLSERKRIQDTYKKYLDIASFDNMDSIHAVAYLSNKTDKIFNMLNKMNIETRYKFYNSYNDLPNSNLLYKDYIELPQSLDLTEQDIKKICTIIKMVK